MTWVKGGKNIFFFVNHFVLLNENPLQVDKPFPYKIEIKPNMKPKLRR